MEEIPRRKRSRRRPRPRNWGTMNPSILACIFQKLVQISDLLLAVPHVCRGWRMAASRTSFFISESHDELNVDRYLHALSTRETAIYLNLLRMELNKTTTLQYRLDRLRFSQHLLLLPLDLILFIAQRTSYLKNLSLPLKNPMISLLAKTLPYWKNLRSFEATAFMSWSTSKTGTEEEALMISCIRLVSRHCKNLTHLGIHGIILDYKQVAQMILTCFPRITSLDFRSCFFSDLALDAILDGARNLKSINLMHAINCGDHERGDHMMMNKFVVVVKVLKERGAKDLKPETVTKLSALQNFTYCGGKTCACCSWFYKVDHFDLYDFIKLL
ncbi:hypothetical protein H6P81_012767 [Aristolochia fimbriata]|uniref:F-box domain-containing protein n=1 Tax=Aristolochia fimbriata TaxID=158543 RepID=A0AAV7EDB7_ARIFI|nr:hypothetical protein H6P81_012767 [Aristolochia fimbriata]